MASVYDRISSNFWNGSKYTSAVLDYLFMWTFILSTDYYIDHLWKTLKMAYAL